MLSLSVLSVTCTPNTVYNARHCRFELRPNLPMIPCLHLSTHQVVCIYTHHLDGGGMRAVGWDVTKLIMSNIPHLNQKKNDDIYMSFLLLGFVFSRGASLHHLSWRGVNLCRRFHYADGTSVPIFVRWSQFLRPDFMTWNDNLCHRSRRGFIHWAGFPGVESHEYLSISVNIFKKLKLTSPWNQGSVLVEVLQWKIPNQRNSC